MLRRCRLCPAGLGGAEGGSELLSLGAVARTQDTAPTRRTLPLGCILATAACFFCPAPRRTTQRTLVAWTSAAPGARRLPVHIPLPLPGIYKGTPHPVALRVPSQEESFGEKKSPSLKLLVLHGNVPHCVDREQIHILPMDTEEPERANQANECPRRPLNN